MGRSTRAADRALERANKQTIENGAREKPVCDVIMGGARRGLARTVGCTRTNIARDERASKTRKPPLTPQPNASYNFDSLQIRVLRQSRTATPHTPRPTLKSAGPQATKKRAMSQATWLWANNGMTRTYAGEFPRITRSTGRLIRSY